MSLPQYCCTIIIIMLKSLNVPCCRLSFPFLLQRTSRATWFDHSESSSYIRGRWHLKCKLQPYLWHINIHKLYILTDKTEHTHVICFHRILKKGPIYISKHAKLPAFTISCYLFRQNRNGNIRGNIDISFILPIFYLFNSPV